MGSNHENRMRGNGAGLMDRTTVGNVDRDVNVGVNIDTDVLGDAVSVDAAGGSKAQARDRLEGQPGAGHLYQRWADHYAQAIHAGVLKEQERLPSVRELRQRHDVSLTTALQILRELESRGLIEARARVGYFVRAQALAMPAAREPQKLVPFDTQSNTFASIGDRISDYLNKARLNGPFKVDLGSAMPAPELFDASFLNRQAIALLREQPNVLVHGPSAPFTHPEFQATMSRYALTFGLTIAPMQIAATMGNSEAVNLTLDALTQPGDVVAIESPTFYGIVQAVEARGLRALEIPSSPHTGMSPEALELALRTYPQLKAVIVVPHLQMPQGATMPDSHKERIVAMCSKHGVALIEDDIYREFVEEAGMHLPCKAWDTDGTVVYCASLSKSFAPGLRLGWMNAGRWHDKVQMIKFSRSRNMPIWPQLLGARTVGTPFYMRHLARLRDRLQRQREQAAQAVAKYFPIGSRLSLPRGGLSIWIELPERVNASQLYDDALARGIRVAPGDMFSNTGHYGHFLRLSCGLPFTQEVDAAYRTIGELMHAQLGMPPR